MLQYRIAAVKHTVKHNFRLLTGDDAPVLGLESNGQRIGRLGCLQANPPPVAVAAPKIRSSSGSAGNPGISARDCCLNSASRQEVVLW
jgi:hypothetical protein